MQRFLKVSLAGLVVAGALAVAPAAWAGCGDVALRQSASYVTDSDNRYFQLANDDGSIVGMWSVQFLIGGNQIDFGYVQWHADGTEFMNSGGRAPATQNYCMGVWKRTAPSTYHLNHYAISYSTAGVIDAKVIIKEDVTLDPRGDTYSGPFTIDVYDPSGNSLLNHVAGRVVGQRLSAN